jgi:hypothetical protein
VGEETWTNKLDRVGRAVWELLHFHPEIEYVRVEAHVGRGHDPQVLATDVGGGVIWVDEQGGDNRQVILPDGNPARPAWLAQRPGEASEPS